MRVSRAKPDEPIEMPFAVKTRMGGKSDALLIILMLCSCCSVDASRAGQGPLIIDIMYNGQLIPAQIAADPYRDKQFNVKFKPRGPGYYTVRVFFSDVEITGNTSPRISFHDFVH